MNLLAETYKSILLQTKRGNSHGVFSNAKPAYLLSIIDAIEVGCIVGNKILYENIELQELYKSDFRKYQYGEGLLFKANVNITPYSLPFFHLNAEPYYHIKWKENVTPPRQAQSPSNKYLRNNVEFSFLDNELWTLLQDANFRKSMRQAIINKFFNTTTTPTI